LELESYQLEIKREKKKIMFEKLFLSIVAMGSYSSPIAGGHTSNTHNKCIIPLVYSSNKDL
jgi:hypothetical protein